MSIAKSVRASLTMNQNPWPARINSGIFVVAMAVQMITRRGTAAMRSTIQPVPAARKRSQMFRRSAP